MEKASNLLLKLSRQLFDDPLEQGHFVNALTQPQPFNPCILWCRPRPEEVPFAIAPAVSWQPAPVDRLALGERPGAHPWHAEGYFYCLDFSSVFAISTLELLTVENGGRSPQTILDLCASPGGKGIFAGTTLRPRLLLSNETIGKRMGALVSNLRRCFMPAANCAPQQVAVVSLDSQVLADAIPQTADLVIVDAPCTGQSLLAKGETAPGCFHPVSINKNANRQKRILANAARLVAPGGHLAYMTCAYSPAENEGVTDWFLERFPQFLPMPVPHLANFQSHLTALPCYRMFPQGGLGAGAFTLLLQNQASGEARPIGADFWERSRPGILTKPDAAAPASTTNPTATNPTATNPTATSHNSDRQ
ncbi:MAG: RsmB/NOP family class I SAM-dependent RNA methyltransferase [Cyanobacteria bacterium J069]|nr:MAG: RsmB/NOP family class I SAM-dependent RNA methyltransferase [Cyanobacteria bacterium J069]